MKIINSPIHFLGVSLAVAKYFLSPRCEAECANLAPASSQTRGLGDFAKQLHTPWLSTKMWIKGRSLKICHLWIDLHPKLQSLLQLHPVLNLGAFQKSRPETSQTLQLHFLVSFRFFCGFFLQWIIWPLRFRLDFCLPCYFLPPPKHLLRVFFPPM